MPTYVDPLCNHGWVIRGEVVKSCHLFADTIEELHAFADRLGLRRAWFQYKPGKLPHYDLTPGKHALALRSGATQLDRRASVDKWRVIKAADAERWETAKARIAAIREALQ